MNSGNTFLDRLIERMDRLDPTSLQSYILRLVREKGFLETIFNTIREGVIVIDRRLRIRFINAAAQGLLGISADAAGQRIDRYVRELDWGPLLKADAEQWRRISRQVIEVFYPSHRVLTFYVVPVNNPGPEDAIPSATLIFHDVTDMYRDAEENVESQKVKAITLLAAGVAHELGNPLNSLHIHLQLLRRTLDRVAEGELRQDAGDLLDVALREVQRLDAILRNFLHAVRPVPPNLSPLNLQVLIEESVSFMRNEIEDRGMRVEVVFPESLPSILGDRDQLKQAFYNLIKNAMEAMHHAGCLRIVCAPRPDFVDIRFVDEGSGIRPEQMSRVLDPYYTTKAEGSGLGLLIVERIVRGHGGELGIESEAGQGSVFTVSLPLRERQLRLLRSPTDDTAAEEQAGTREP
ncbi:MAG: PAS domain-containing protein [Lentisphaeria bacterium]|nr:PAS domain-containing protein [Lentisphaeria bacterium]